MNLNDQFRKLLNLMVIIHTADNDPAADPVAEVGNNTSYIMHKFNCNLLDIFFYRSGYQLFSSELLGKMTNIKSNERMGEIAKQWKALSDKKRMNYTNKRLALVAEYTTAVEKFKEVNSA